MPDALDEEEIEDILDAYEELGTAKAVSEELDYSDRTVRKYVNKAKEEEDPRVIDEDPDEGDEDDGPWAGAGPGEDPFAGGPATRSQEDYTGLSPGDFIRDFFEDFEVGVKTKWVELQAKRADRRQKLPSQDALISDLLGMNSGIAQNAYREATYIADEYWAEAQEYLAQTGRDIDHTAMSSMAGGMQEHSTHHHPGTYGDGPGWVGGGVSPPSPGGGGGQDQMMQALLQELRQLRNEIGGGGQNQHPSGERQGTLEYLQELKQMQEMLEEIGGEDEFQRQIREQIQSLQTQLAQQEQGGGQPTRPQAESFEDKLINLAATREDVDLDDILDIVERRQGVETDPRVLEKKYEKEMKEAELQHESDRYKRLGDVAEGLAQELGSAFGQAIVGSGQNQGGGESASRETEADGGAARPAATAAQSANQTEGEPCPHCQTPMTPTPTGTHCEECGYGVAQCDLCTTPVEIPPRGEADYGICPECKEVTPLEEGSDGLVTCSECGWEGPHDGVMAEVLECSGCGEFRPVTREDMPIADQAEMMGR